MENTKPKRYDKRMNDEQIKRYMLFFEDVRAHLESGMPSAQSAIDALQAIAFNAIVTIEKIRREE